MPASPKLYAHVIRPLLFRLPAEPAQKLAEFALRRSWAWSAIEGRFRVDEAGLGLDFCGLKLRSPIGLAAGFDKSCQLLPSLAALGFGYLVGGTVTESPRPGNPRPRMFRNTGDQSLINALGFPNKGLEHVARTLEKTRETFVDTPIVVSVSGTTVEEMVACHRRIEPLVDAVELNISSPNTAGLRMFHDAPALGDLIDKVSEARLRPLMVKFPPYPTPSPARGYGDEAKERVLSMARTCADKGVDALTVANSRPTEDPRLSTKIGGLSGKPIFPDTLRMVAEVREETGDRVAINACGGIFTGEDAWQALEAGADTVQLYTGIVYRGPAAVKNINRELAGILRQEIAASLEADSRPTQSP